MLSILPKDSGKSFVISLSIFKKELGKTADKMTEEQILKLRENQDQMAEVFFAMWLNNTKNKKNELQYKHGKGYSKELPNILPSELSKTSSTG